MINRYPLWKNLLVAIVVALGIIYALPNVFGDDPALQISASRGTKVDAALQSRVIEALDAGRFTYKSYSLDHSMLLVRFNDTDTQLKAYERIREQFGDNFVVAQNLAPATPAWLNAFNAKPMYLGLDLRGGVHFLMEVDMDAVEKQAAERYESDLRGRLQEGKLRYSSVAAREKRVEMKFRDAAERDKAQELIKDYNRTLVLTVADEGEFFNLYAVPGEQEMIDLRSFAVKQNIQTLRNRINELGVAEPVIQQQGDDRIVVQLPGVQDTAEAKRLLGATATLEYRMVDEEHSLDEALAGRVPPNSRLYRKRDRERDGGYVLLKKQVIIKGDQITDAASGIDQQSGGPQVSVTLDSEGAMRMLDNTKKNVGKQMAVVFIENRPETRIVDGKAEHVTRRVEEVISVATIQGVFSKNFQTTGLDSPQEARELALLLRAGALVAPMEIVEERTVGPSLGKENIEKGFNSNIYGFAAIAIFMMIYYRVFGTISVVALAINAVLMVAVLSLMQATLTLPGMAGIALTIGMAIDANVLINERIREELRAGNTPHAAIHAGYERAFGTIMDSNITTLIAGVALFWLGSGPVRGFAVVLCIGILTSMFSAVVVSRGIVNLVYGRKARIARLSI
ncbi:MAG TPA: protein translocase subunit SecD [Gammaproteobacteria bacterium]